MRSRPGPCSKGCGVITENRSGVCTPCALVVSKERRDRDGGADNRARVMRNYQVRREIIDTAKARPCADCGVQYPSYVMQFDHRPGEVKVANIAQMAANRALAVIEAEIAKCDVVCANCHAERTHGTRRKTYA